MHVLFSLGSTKKYIHAHTLTTFILSMVISDINAFLLALGTWAKQACPVDSMVVAQLVVICDINATIIDPLQRVQTQRFQCGDSHHQKRVAPSDRMKIVFRLTESFMYIRLCNSKSYIKTPQLSITTGLAPSLKSKSESSKSTSM